MAEIGYLLGAGASAKVLPVVSQFNTRLESFKSYMQNSKPFQSNQSDSHYSSFITDLEALIHDAKLHASVDTLAKKHYLRRERHKLNLLKLLLSMFFLVEEAIVKFDLRYELLFSNLLERGNGPTPSSIDLPDRIKIFSWNYDSQIERALNSFFQYSIESRKQFFTRIQSIPTVDQHSRDDIDLSKFTILKLNGMAGVHTTASKIERIFLEEGVDFSKDHIIESAMNLYKAFKLNPDEFEPQINFAWEQEGIANYIREQAFRVAPLIEYLVIIGYSFPNFNRDMDRALIEKMSNCRKVYIQSTAGTIDEITSRFRAIRPTLTDIVQSVDENQFILPYEY